MARGWWSTMFLRRPYCSGRSILVPILLSIARPSTLTDRDGVWGHHLGNEAYVRDELANFMRQTGPALAPFNAWVMLKSLETLPVRVDAHCDNAEKLVDFLNIMTRWGG